MTCGLIRARVNPSDAELRELYKKEYFFGEEYYDYFMDRPALEKNFLQRLKRLQKYLSKQSKVIEIGCSYGFFLNLCKEYVKECIGFDITKDGIDHAVSHFGLEAYCLDFVNYNGSPADVICMWDVIEHLGRPDEMLRKISASLKVGGHFVFTTGDIGSMVAKIRKDKWRMVHPPTHLFYFDKESITKILEKNNFRILRIKYVTIYRNVYSVLNQLYRNTSGSKVKKICWRLAVHLSKYSGIGKWNVGMNLFDVMEVIAIKVR